MKKKNKPKDTILKSCATEGHTQVLFLVREEAESTLYVAE